MCSCIDPVFMVGKEWYFLFQRCIMNLYVLSGDSIMYGLINTKIPKNISAARSFSVSFDLGKGISYLSNQDKTGDTKIRKIPANPI